MQIKRDPSFVRALKKLDKQKRRTVLETIEIFAEDPLDPRLKNHALTGSLSGHRAISANSNLRIIFKEIGNYLIVIFIDAGSHDRVYRRRR
jgi:addiction module RelE/StbE family toxin